MSEKQEQSTMNDPTLDVVVSVLHELTSADLKRINERNDVNQAIQHHVSTCYRCQRLIEYEDPLFVHARRLRSEERARRIAAALVSMTESFGSFESALERINKLPLDPDWLSLCEGLVNSFDGDEYDVWNFFFSGVTAEEVARWPMPTDDTSLFSLRKRLGCTAKDMPIIRLSDLMGVPSEPEPEDANTERRNQE